MQTLKKKKILKKNSVRILRKAIAQKFNFRLKGNKKTQEFVLIPFLDNVANDDEVWASQGINFSHRIFMTDHWCQPIRATGESIVDEDWSFLQRVGHKEAFSEKRNFEKESSKVAKHEAFFKDAWEERLQYKNYLSRAPGFTTRKFFCTSMSRLGRRKWEKSWKQIFWSFKSSKLHNNLLFASSFHGSKI